MQWFMTTQQSFLFTQIVKAYLSSKLQAQRYGTFRFKILSFFSSFSKFCVFLFTLLIFLFLRFFSYLFSTNSVFLEIIIFYKYTQMST